MDLEILQYWRTFCLSITARETNWIRLVIKGKVSLKSCKTCAAHKGTPEEKPEAMPRRLHWVPVWTPQCCWISFLLTLCHTWTFQVLELLDYEIV